MTTASTPPSQPATEIALDSDFILPFMIEKSGIRGRLVRLESVVDTIISRPNYPGPVACLLSELVPLATILASSLKYDGIFTLQTSSDGPVKTLVADVTQSGHVRGYAGFNQDSIDQPDATIQPGKLMDIETWLGDGHLAFTVDQGPYAERYQGLVALKGDSLKDCLLHYFRQSQQINAGILLASDHVGLNGHKRWRSSALLLESVPRDGREPDKEETDEDWRRAIILMASCQPGEMLDFELEPERLLYRLFHEDGVRVFERRPVQVGCRCTPEKLERVLKSLPYDDVESLKKDEGGIEMTCEFCAKTFSFSAEEIDDFQARRSRR
jgi:molecular chaperone Hsp33